MSGPRAPGAWPKEALAGVAVGVVSLPFCLGFGLIAFGALGEAGALVGPRAGLVGGAVVALVAGLLGGTRGQASAPIVAGALVLAELARALLADPRLPADPTERTSVVVGVAALAVAGAGALQALGGALGVGKAVRYLAYPVVAGLMAGVAVLTLMGQLAAFLGPGGVAGWRAEPLSPAALATFALGVAAVLATVAGPRLAPRVPGPLLGLGLGIALGALATRALSCPVPTMDALAPEAPRLVDPRPALRFLASAGATPAVSLLAGPALSIALFSSLNSLLSACAMDALTGERHDADRELVGQGVANLAASLFAGLPGGGLASLSSLNHRSGGRSAVATTAQAVTLLAFAVLLGPLLPWIPRVALAGVIVVTAANLVDPWIARLARAAVAGDRRPERLATLVDLGVVLLVATTAVLSGLVQAIALGMAVSCLHFVVRMGAVRFRLSGRGDTIRSRRARPVGDLEHLGAAGRAIAVFELEGPLFFWSAERIAQRIEAESADAGYVVIGLGRLDDIDATGFRVLARLLVRMGREGRHALVAHATFDERFRRRLLDMGVGQAELATHSFQETDAALAWAEDRVLEARGAAPAASSVPLAAIDVVRDLPPAFAEWLDRNAEREEHASGSFVFRQGDTDRAVYFLGSGLVSIVGASGNGSPHELASFGPGTVFGEIALLDAGPRSASVVARAPTTCWRLPAEAFERLRREDAGLALAFVNGLALALARRLRAASAEIRALRD